MTFRMGSFMHEQIRQQASSPDHAHAPEVRSMSEIRNVKPPVPAMSGDKVVKPVERKARKAPISAAAAAKPVKVKAAIVPAHRNAKGDRLRCFVTKPDGTQCSNPARHERGPKWTCSTHKRALDAGVKRGFVKAATAVYVAPHAPVAAGK
jgi:hypothetical protein